ncbi:hypothetical protein GH714_014778 [Hevea brasiliensis]|uniref:Uncharacterized protein n=1 Tax=Hevea brasiliensis TaxID=3981 RepID=A0A6A6KVG9_HEVBR|nr:hypothetical protein GH714_014778 [Hevea brasiliensis]
MAEKHKKPHAIVFAYPLQGHIVPVVHLALKLASHGFTITFINPTPSTITHPRPIPKLVQSCLPRPANQFLAALLHVFSAHAEEVVAKIVASGEDVHCLIADTFFVWPSKIAKKFDLVHVSFWTEPALVFTLYYHWDLLRLNGHFDCQDCREDTIDYIPGVKAIEPKDTTSYLQETDTTSICHQIIYSCFIDTKNADFVLCNTVQELEHDTISALQAKIPYYAIGPIFPNDFSKTIVATSLWSESQCTKWLDKRPHASVLYVSFGSYAHVTKNDLVEIASGLSLSKVSFVLVLRPDVVSSDDADPLPVGFKEEVADRALLYLVVDDWKIGINLSNKKVISKEEVSDNINRLMSGESKDEFKNSIKEIKKTLESAVSPSGSSEKNMLQFIKDLEAKIEKIAHAKNSNCNGHV